MMPWNYDVWITKDGYEIRKCKLCKARWHRLRYRNDPAFRQRALAEMKRRYRERKRGASLAIGEGAGGQQPPASSLARADQRDGLR
jgi:hypothetical protein